MKQIPYTTQYLIECRTPRGVRGLKPIADAGGGAKAASHPARGAWIETGQTTTRSRSSSSRTPRGVRGLKQALRL